MLFVLVGLLTKIRAQRLSARRGRAHYFINFARFLFSLFSFVSSCAFFHSLLLRVFYFPCFALLALPCFLPCFLSCLFHSLSFIVRCFLVLSLFCFSLISIIYNNKINIYSNYIVCVCVRARTTKERQNKAQKRAAKKPPQHVIQKSN